MSCCPQRINRGVKLRHQTGMCFQLKPVDDEFHVDQAAGQHFHIQFAFWRLMRGHVPAHAGDIGPQLFGVALAMQNIRDNSIHLRAGGGRSKQHACPRQRHMLPRPRIFALILVKAFHRRAEQAVGARWPKPCVDLI